MLVGFARRSVVSAASASGSALAAPQIAAATVCCRDFHATAPTERFRKYGRGMRYKLALSTKRSNRRFYKGKGGTSEGRHTNKGGYIIDPDKVLALSVPDLTGCEVRRARQPRRCCRLSQPTMRTGCSPPSPPQRALWSSIYD